MDTVKHIMDQLNCNRASTLSGIGGIVGDSIKNLAAPLVDPGPAKSQEANAATMPKGPHLPMLSHFPALKGPLQVGSLDLEIATKGLALKDDKDPQVFFEKPSTILFRLFYPTDRPTKRPVFWVPEPHQTEYLHAYEQYAGSGGLRNFVLG